MPRISEFYGIVIALYFADHSPPHFHAIYAEYEATVDIDRGVILAGTLPTRASGMVREWASLHREDLELAWQRSQRGEAPGKIDPLP